MTTTKRPADCYCRGAGICDNNHHICEDCTCDLHNDAPQTARYEHANPSTARQELRK